MCAPWPAHVEAIGSAGSWNSRQAPWVHVVAQGFAEPEPSAGTLLTILPGDEMTTVDGLLAAFVRELRFPEYFGWNWAAFSECMRDLSWLPARAYKIVIQDAQAPCRRSPAT